MKSLDAFSLFCIAPFYSTNHKNVRLTSLLLDIMLTENTLNSSLNMQERAHF